MNIEDAAPPIPWHEGFPVTAGHMRLGLTESSPETREFWEGVGRGELMLKQCLHCSRHLYPRRMACPDHPLAGIRWVKAGGKGNIYSVSTVYRAPSEEFAGAVPYHVGIVELAEKVHLFTRFVTENGREPRIGDAVSLEFRVLENRQKLPVFALLPATGG